MTFDIIRTGSKGNAVVIGGSVLIDCGVPYAALRPHEQSLALLLLTHEHGDHFKASTLRRIARERPLLRVGCPPYLVERALRAGVAAQQIDVLEPGETSYSYGALALQAFPLLHNVPNCGYKLTIDGKRILYATDTNSMQHVEAKDFDLYLLEANYSDAEIAQRIRDKQEAGIYCHEWDVVKNHLSVEKANDWLYSQMGPNSRYVYLHGHQEEATA